MCAWGTNRTIHVIRRNHPDIPDGWHEMAVDACIADEVQRLNDLGIITVGCCCGHGKSRPQVLIAAESEALLRQQRMDYDWYDARTLIHYLERP